ncbi:ABC transporter permease [Rummeliibacillus pycnus]|uniref:ABC transporter permease n=1 Tax=Rummeliibacillus pycnus TaxID=101070 RepID=UPI000C99E310|nr:ABC transporter permease [Rummeliibacillus pycnus]
MIRNLIVTDFLKIKRKGFWLLSFLGPLGVVAMQMVNYGVRKDYLLKQSNDDWGYYLDNVSTFTPLAIVLGIAILTSLIVSVEDETNAWKQLIALPVSKINVYLSKFAVVFSLLFFSSCFLMIFTLGFGVFLDLGKPIPYFEIFKYSFYPFLAAFPVLALQLWIAVVSQNQGIPITIGIVGTILAFTGSALPDWMIWKWPSLVNEWDNPILNVVFGITIGCMLYIVGMLDFNRRDVK